MKLGNDFAGDGEQNTKDREESDENTSDDELEEEKENSGEPDNTKTTDDESDEKDSGESDESTGDDAAEDKKDEKDESSKSKEEILNSLLETEKDLDKNNSSIDVQIAEARKRLYQKRGLRRGKVEINKLIDSKFPDQEDEDTDDLSDIDSDTLKVLERFTKAKGLVPKSELNQMTYKQIHKTSEETFYDTHKEYLPENDANDILYNALQEELALFAAPKDAKMIPKLFEKAHREVIKRFPDLFKKVETVSKKENVNNEEDKKKSIRLKNAGLGGGNSGGSGSGGETDNTSKKSVSLNSDQVASLRRGGWTEKEIQELQGK